jgi:hypothetical protein
MISIQDFARLVASMRRAQKTEKEWPHDPGPAKIARKWENQVDAAAREILAPPDLPLTDGAA